MAIMTGAEAVTEIISREGVEYVFGLPGSTEILFMDALQDRPEIKYILCLHETVAVAMAEGYSRVSDKVAVVNLHTVPGLAAAMPMLGNAFGAGVPLIITAGQQDSRILMQEPVLSGDLKRMAEGYSKWSAEVFRVEDIPLTMRRAFKVATQPPTGPVFVSLPQDILAQNIDLEYIPNNSVHPLVQSSPDSIWEASELLLKAKKPVILVGFGISKYDAVSEVVKLAELIGARVYQVWMSDMNFPTNHPQYLGDLVASSFETREVLQSVDVLVVIGAPPFKPHRYLAQPVLTARTKLIQIDDNPWEIAKNFPTDSSLQGDIKVSISELNKIYRRKCQTRCVR